SASLTSSSTGIFPTRYHPVYSSTLCINSTSPIPSKVVLTLLCSDPSSLNTDSVVTLEASACTIYWLSALTIDSSLPSPSEILSSSFNIPLVEISSTST